MRVRNVANQIEGAAFEKAFSFTAARQGLFCVRNGQECRFLGNGRVLPVKSNLDWMLAFPDGRVVFVDTKSFRGCHFTYSQLSQAQLRRARRYEQFSILAGFVVHLRQSRHVVWFSVAHVDKKGPRSAFGHADGTLLGTFTSFDLRAIALSH